MIDIIELVREYNTMEYAKFRNLYYDYVNSYKQMSYIVATAATNAQLGMNPEIKHLSFAFLDSLAIEPKFSSKDYIEYKSFVLDKTILYNMIRVAVIDYMNDECVPLPNSMVIGKCLKNAVISGRLPKRFKCRVMNFDLRYDSGIDGIVFL